MLTKVLGDILEMGEYMSNREVQISKFLSLVLRHKPQTIDIQLDQHGWVDVDVLIEKINNHGITLDREFLQHIVQTNSKQRFAFDETNTKIRASQGHSVKIELGYSNQQPPEILYHGTGEKFVASILQTGLEKRNRQHVHLSKDINTALQVGKRHGKPFIFEVMAHLMYAENFQFYLSENGVWLTDNVPVRFLKPMV